MFPRGFEDTPTFRQLRMPLVIGSEPTVMTEHKSQHWDATAKFQIAKSNNTLLEVGLGHSWSLVTCDYENNK